ncbi:NADPH dehydrogenase [Serratia quinivorans]|nr:NADPH dehydrogenase [Serratia quinivorans]CAI1600127.1 NADPH dehydrogenase [Serratia quinivorans]
MSQLFTPIALGKLNLPNRIIIAPMCQYSADHGKATEWHTLHLGHLSLSGAGLLIVEASAVAPEGRITPATSVCGARLPGRMLSAHPGIR